MIKKFGTLFLLSNSKIYNWLIATINIGTIIYLFLAKDYILILILIIVYLIFFGVYQKSNIKNKRRQEILSELNGVKKEVGLWTKRIKFWQS